MVTHHLITQATSTLGRPPGNNVHFICTTEAELPSSGVINDDCAFCEDTGNSFMRVDGNWELNTSIARHVIRSGLIALINGAVVVNDSTVTPKTIVIAGFKTLIGTSAGILTWTVVAGTSFTITSVGATGSVVATDASLISYFLVETP